MVVLPLVWSDQLAQVAQDWTNHLIATGALSHRPNNRYGENIYAISGGHATPAEVVDAWAKEALVWGKSRAVGRAVATDRGREVWGLQLRSRRKRHRVPTILSTKIAARAHFADTDSHRSLSVMSRQLCSGNNGFTTQKRSGWSRCFHRDMCLASPAIGHAADGLHQHTSILYGCALVAGRSRNCTTGDAKT